MPSQIKDYYKILQVHHDASLDVIKAAYRKLCTLYHPDTTKNANAAAQMSEINEAYTVLSDPQKRTAYHRLWQDTFTERSSHVFPAAHPPQGIRTDSAKAVMEQFFHALFTKNWNTAYTCLTREDWQRIPPEEFYDWRDAIADCFEMQDYRIRSYRSYDRCRIGQTVYVQAVEFAVVIHDMDLQTSQVTQSIPHKFAAFDGLSWKVCLGVNSVKRATLKYKLMAQRRKDYDPVELYRSAVSKNDPLTGLLSESGFYEEALKEVERFKRYHSPLSLIAFQIHCENGEREIPCLCQCAGIIKANSRITDIIARFGDNRIVCLLAETTEQQAMRAAQKFARSIRERQTEPFTLNAGIIQYTGKAALEDTVFAACSDAGRSGDTIRLSHKSFPF